MTALATSEAARLADLETAIERGLTMFMEVGEALREIHEARLYRADHSTFENYCRERWGFTDRRGRQLMEAAEIGTQVPVQSERQARELARLRSNPDRMTSAWKEAAEQAQGEDRSVTTADVRAAVAARMPKSAPPAESRIERRAPQSRKASANGKPTAEVRRAVERQLPEPPPVRSPAEEVESFAARCRPVPSTIEALDIDAAVRGRPEKADEWRASFSAARDALDELIEQSGAEARKQAEAKATADRAGMEAPR